MGISILAWLSSLDPYWPSIYNHLSFYIVSKHTNHSIILSVTLSLSVIDFILKGVSVFSLVI